MKKSLPKYLFLLLVLLVTLAFFGLIGDFLMAVFWAVILTILFQSSYIKIKSWAPSRPNQAAALTLVYVLLIAIIPMGIVVTAVTLEAKSVIDKLNENDKPFNEQVKDLQEQIPFKDKTLEKYGLSKEIIKDKISQSIREGLKALAGRAVGITQNVFGVFLNLFLTLYIFFFFLRDGKQLIRSIIWAIPINDKREKELFQRFESVARATVKGSLIVAFVQGSIGGVLFWTLGIEAAFLWGVIMVIASLLPVGSALVWGPWAAILIFQGDYVRGIVLIAVGAGFIAVIDNFMRPRLVGKDTQMPDYLVLISTLGGLVWFGLAGFVIGPIVAALFITCWQMMGKEYGRRKKEQQMPMEGKREGEKEL